MSSRETRRSRPRQPLPPFLEQRWQERRTKEARHRLSFNPQIKDAYHMIPGSV